MKPVKSTAAGLLITMITWSANASPITFVYTEPTAMLSGSFTIDDTLLNGTSFQFLFNTSISAFTFTNGVTTWGLGDLLPGSGFFFDSTGPIPDVVNAGGNTATSPAVLFFSGTGGATADGISKGGDWNAVPTPEPGTLALFGIGLACLGFARRRKAA